MMYATIFCKQWTCDKQIAAQITSLTTPIRYLKRRNTKLDRNQDLVVQV